MKLYYAPGSCALASHIIAREAGLPVEISRVTFGPEGRFADGVDYYSINPKGAVPAMEIAPGEVLTEGAVLLQYLASQPGGEALGPPAEGLARWRFLELLNFISTEVHKGFSPLFKPGLTAEAREGIIANLKPRFDVLETRLAGGSTYLTGASFTIADAYAFTVLNWSNLHKVDLTPWPNIVAFQARVAGRAGVQQAMREEGLID